MVDFYGSIPFSDWRKVNRIPPLTYEPGYDIYTQIFADLDEAIKILKERQPSTAEIAKIEDPQLKTFTQGKWQNWVKFANCIKLRMAMNIVKSHPDVAEAKYKEAINDEIGVLTADDPRDLAYYMEDYNASNVWYFISVSWNDIRLGASLENILKHFNHPLTYRWFDRNANPITDKFTGIQYMDADVLGMRAGLNMSATNTTDRKQNYGPFSVLTGEYQYMAQPFFKRVEVLFLRAEGALRGWESTSAKEFYEAGIRLSLTDDGVSTNEPLSKQVIDAYINQTVDDVRQVDYKDPYDYNNNIAGRVKIGVKWDENDSKELKLEKIITQKYIANFPMGAEAWTNYRRTGYPRLFPPKVNPEAGLNTELQLRRIPFDETADNALEISSLEAALNGDNSPATRVFWDIPTESYGEKSDDNEYNLVIPNNF